MADVRLLEAVVPSEEGFYCVLGLKNGSHYSQTHHETIEEVETQADHLVASGVDVFFGCGKFITDENRDASNCGSLKSFFLDIDCGEDKAKPDKRGRIRGYVDQPTGLQALKDLCKTLKLPRPTIVNSGRGWHVYWPLTEAVPKDKWLPVAETFKAKCLEHKFIVDPAVPADAARVLRIPGTKNFKDTPPHDVVLMHLSEPVVFDDFAALMGPLIDVKKPYAPKELDDFTKAVIGNKQSRFRTIMKKTADGQGCEQLKLLIEDQENAEEPLWRAGLSIAQHCVDRDKAIHIISKNHPKYSARDTERKASQIKGPYTCDTFDSFVPGICGICPHRGKIKSPIVLGHEIAKSEEGDVIEYQTTSIDPQPVEFVVPKLPNRYFRGKNGGIYKHLKEDNEEGDGPAVALIYEYDLFVTKRMYDPALGETILIRRVLPRDGAKEFPVPLVDALSKDELRKVVSFHGIIAGATQMASILDYLMQCAKELQVSQEVEMMRLQFGWADDDEKFILGNREIGASYVKYSPPSKATRDIAHALRPIGSLDEWKEIINVYNMPGFEPHAFAVFSAFGAPLIKFMGVKGGIINLINNKSGTGKSTILQVMNSVWGHPDELMIQWRDTLNVKLHRMAVMCNLPLGVDEITKMSGDDFSDMAYSVTQGAPRRRMKASTNEERESQGFWATMMVATSNSSMTDKLESLKSTSEGELMRLMQYKIDPTNNLDKATAKHIFGRLNSNYGLAGQPYAQYLVQNLEEVVDTALKVQARFDKAVNIDTRERFWSAMAGANLTGALIASKLGLHEINHKRVFDWAVAEVSEMQTATKLSFNDYATVVGEFLLKHNLNILVVNKFSSSKSGIASTPLVMPRGPLVVRHEPDTRRIYIIRQELKNFCVLKQVTFNDLLSGLNKTGAFIAEVRTRLDIGTDISAPPVVALEFDSDLLGVDFNFATQGDED
jgi:energy-coupling factor transporter ATP-binding protein EcfA2